MIHTSAHSRDPSPETFLSGETVEKEKKSDFVSILAAFTIATKMEPLIKNCAKEVT